MTHINDAFVDRSLQARPENLVGRQALDEREAGVFILKLLTLERISLEKL